MSFNLDEYVDVAERIRMFAEKFPEGSLQGDGYFVRDPEEKIVGYHYVARAYRTAADERPGVGTAYEPIPGKTQFTRDSEVQNAETAAWGRAIVALGFNTKKIASVEEVRARQSSGGEGVDGLGQPPPSGGGSLPASPGTFQPPADVREELAAKAASSVPSDGGVPEEVVIGFGKHRGSKLVELLESNKGYVEWLAGEKFDPKTKDQRRVKGAAQMLLGVPLTFHGDGGGVADDDIPFMPTIDGAA